VVEAGAALSPGSLYPADLLRTGGDTRTERYLVDEVQEVYRSQGVEINDKHIEIIVRQMMKKVRILTQGDTVFLPGQLVDRHPFRVENERIVAEGGQPAEAEQVILGITKASLATESFLSAASFQETTKVLTDRRHRRQGRQPGRPQGETSSSASSSRPAPACGATARSRSSPPGSVRRSRRPSRRSATEARRSTRPSAMGQADGKARRALPSACEPWYTTRLPSAGRHRRRQSGRLHGHDQPARAQRPREQDQAGQDPRTQGIAAEAGRLYACLHPTPKKPNSALRKVARVG